MAGSQADILRSAITRNAGAVLSLPSAGILRHCKTRFLSETEEGDEPAFWVETDPNERLLVEELIASKKAAAVSFKNGTNKVVFLSPILAQDLEHRINGETTVPAVLMKWPAEIKSVQRRNNYRVRVSANSEISVRIWRIPDHAYIGDRPLAAQELALEFRDLSIGGIGVNFQPKNSEPVKVSSADRLRIQLTVGDKPLLLEGRMMFPEKVPAEPKPVRAGIQFKPLETDLEGRQKLALLTRVVGDMQREEVRRFRLGMAG